MLREIVTLVASVGVGFVVAGVCWRYFCPWFVDLPAGDDLALLAVREGVAVALVVAGLGIALVGVGTLEPLASIGDETVGPLVTLASVLPVREAGGFFTACGLSLLGGSLLVPVGTEVRRNVRE